MSNYNGADGRKKLAKKITDHYLQATDLASTRRNEILNANYQGRILDIHNDN